MSPRALRLELVPSLPLAAAIAIVHAAAALSTLIVLPGAPGIAIALLLGALGLVSAAGRALLCLPTSVCALVVSDGQAIEVELRNGARLSAQAPARRFVHSWAVALPLGRPVRRTILVTRDMLGRDAFRKLRIWALWGRLPPASGVCAAA